MVTTVFALQHYRSMVAIFIRGGIYQPQFSLKFQINNTFCNPGHDAPYPGEPFTSKIAQNGFVLSDDYCSYVTFISLSSKSKPIQGCQQRVGTVQAFLLKTKACTETCSNTFWPV